MVGSKTTHFEEGQVKRVRKSTRPEPDNSTQRARGEQVSETREQVMVEDIRPSWKPSRRMILRVTKAGNSRRCNTTANGL
jgi:hypothetical protein